MSVSLYRVSRISWAVKSANDNELHSFPNIEAASEYMEKLGIYSDEIDAALIQMAAQCHTRAQFGVNNTFVVSDNKRPDEIIGTA